MTTIEMRRPDARQSLAEIVRRRAGRAGAGDAGGAEPAHPQRVRPRRDAGVLATTPCRA